MKKIQEDFQSTPQTTSSFTQRAKFEQLKRFVITEVVKGGLSSVISQPLQATK